MRKEIIFTPFKRWLVYLNRYAQPANALPVWMHPYVASMMYTTGESCTIICIFYLYIWTLFYMPMSYIFPFLACFIKSLSFLGWQHLWLSRLPKLQILRI